MISGKRETSRQKNKKQFCELQGVKKPQGGGKEKKKVDIYSTVEITFLDLHKIVYN